MNSKNFIKNETNKTNNSIRLSKVPFKNITNDINYDQRYTINSQSDVNNDTNNTNNSIRLSNLPIRDISYSIDDSRDVINAERSLNNETNLINETNNSIIFSKTSIKNVKTNQKVRRVVNSYEDNPNTSLTHINKFYYNNVIIHDRSKDKNYNM